jgi:hypothetical protein
VSTSQYLLNLGLLGFVLVSNLGTKTLTRQRFLLPIVIVVAVGCWFLPDLPTAGHDAGLELVGAAVGAGLGIAAAYLMRVHRDPGGRLVATAGPAYATVWVVVIGGRMVFAYGADHWYPDTIARFSVSHQITGADAWTAAFVLMALTMVLSRVTVTALTAARVRTAPATAAPAAINH